MIKIELALFDAVKYAIKTMGIKEFKKCSFFQSSQKEPKK